METSSKWKRITENPTLILISTITLAIISAIAGLVAIWEFFTGENFPQFLARKGWEVTMPSWYYSFVIVLLCTVVMLQAKLTRTVLARRRELGWLETLADEDDRDIENRVWAHYWNQDSAPVRPHFTGPEPHIDLMMIVQNKTVFSLKYHHLEGKFDFYKSPLQQAPQPANQVFEIKHAEPYKLKIRQFLQPATVEQIIKDGEAIIGGGNVAVFCTYINRMGETKYTRITLNDLRFKVPPG